MRLSSRANVFQSARISPRERKRKRETSLLVQCKTHAAESVMKLNTQRARFSAVGDAKRGVKKKQKRNGEEHPL